jgi:hypothetical protein
MLTKFYSIAARPAAAAHLISSRLPLSKNFDIIWNVDYYSYYIPHEGGIQ